MSAYFVSRQTVHDAVTAWTWVFQQPRSQAQLDQIGRQLWAMNAEAIRQRYPSVIGTDEERDMTGAAAAYAYRHPRNLTPAQMAKSAHCLRYQCSEGNVPETFPTYRYLDQACEAMGNPPGYDAAAWDRETDEVAA